MQLLTDCRSREYNGDMVHAIVWLLVTVGYDHTVTAGPFLAWEACELVRLEYVGRKRDTYCLPEEGTWTPRKKPQA